MGISGWSVLGFRVLGRGSIERIPGGMEGERVGWSERERRERERARERERERRERKRERERGERERERHREREKVCERWREREREREKGKIERIPGLSARDKRRPIPRLRDTALE